MTQSISRIQHYPNCYNLPAGTRVQRDLVDDTIFFFLPNGVIMEYLEEDDNAYFLRKVTQQ